MIGTVAAIERGPGREMAALMVDGQLQDILIDPRPDDSSPQPGAIYRGILDRTPKGMHGALVRLGNGQTGFLKETKGLAPGATIWFRFQQQPSRAKLRLLHSACYLKAGMPSLPLAHRA